MFVLKLCQYNILRHLQHFYRKTFLYFRMRSRSYNSFEFSLPEFGTTQSYLCWPSPFSSTCPFSALRSTPKIRYCKVQEHFGFYLSFIKNTKHYIRIIFKHIFQGVAVIHVEPNSTILGPSGLKLGDVITTLNGCNIKDSRQWHHCLSQADHVSSTFKFLFKLYRQKN